MVAFILQMISIHALTIIDLSSNVPMNVPQRKTCGDNIGSFGYQGLSHWPRRPLVPIRCGALHASCCAPYRDTDVDLLSCKHAAIARRDYEGQHEQGGAAYIENDV